MAEIELIGPQRDAEIRFALEPAHNGLVSLFLLSSAKPGIGEWVAQTAAKLSPEELQTNRTVCRAAAVHLDGVSWPTFPAWVEDLGGRDPQVMRDQDLEATLSKTALCLDEDDVLPTPAELTDDRAAYLALIRRMFECKGSEWDRAFYEEYYELLSDPPARQQLIVAHLRRMWEEYLAAEWERNLPALQDSVAAFASLDQGRLSSIEIILQTVERQELPNMWERHLEGVEQVILVPSVHIGPYTMMLDARQTSVRIGVRARIPKGAAISSPALSRSDLVMRLGALDDDTRLRILELLAREGERDTKYIMKRLGLSQSSASRHLGQLSATGYLITRRHEGVNRYRLNQERIDDTLEQLKEFLR